MSLDLFEGFFGQVVVEILLRLIAGKDLHPVDLALPGVRLLHRAVDDVLRGAPDVGAGAVALDVRDDRIVGDDDLAVAIVDAGPVCHSARSLVETAAPEQHGDTHAAMITVTAAYCVVMTSFESIPSWSENGSSPFALEI